MFCTSGQAPLRSRARVSYAGACRKGPPGAALGVVVDGEAGSVQDGFVSGVDESSLRRSLAEARCAADRPPHDTGPLAWRNAFRGACRTSSSPPVGSCGCLAFIISGGIGRTRYAYHGTSALVWRPSGSQLGPNHSQLGSILLLVPDPERLRRISAWFRPALCI